MKIDKLLENIPYELVQGNLDQDITGICHNDKVVEEGYCFVCISGSRFDSHTLIPKVVEKGARLIVVEKDCELPEGVTVVKVEDCRLAAALIATNFYDHPAEKLVMVGVTGSKGKTTITHMLANILRGAGYTVGTLGTIGASIPKSDLSQSNTWGITKADVFDDEYTPNHYRFDYLNTTPDAMEVQMYLHHMVETGCTHCVMEASSAGLFMHRVGGIIYDYGVWINIVHGDHVGGFEHKDFDEYFNAKAMLIKQSRKAFVFAENEFSERLLNEAVADGNPTEKIYTFGDKETRDFYGHNLEHTFDEKTRRPGLEFDIDGLLHRHVKTNFPGDYNMYNAMAAVIVAHYLGVDDEEIINEALMHVHIRGRFEFVIDNPHFRVVTDFSHSRQSTFAHLEAIREYRPKRLVCVYGSEGSRDYDRRVGMGEATAKCADFSILTECHNRWESMEAVFRGVLEGIEKAEQDMGHRANYIIIPNREEAIRYALEHVEDGDFITCLGLGHEEYLDRGEYLYPHDDKEVVRRLSKELGLLEEDRDWTKK